MQPLLIPLCFVTAWVFILMLIWMLGSGIRDTMNRAKQMHQIPCSTCQFFTNNHRLKCTVRPHCASTEQAINCLDYRQVSIY